MSVKCIFEQQNLFGPDLKQVKQDLAGMSVGDAIEFGADYVIRVSFIGCTSGWPMYGRRMYEYTDYVDFYGVAYGDDAMVQVLREIY